MTSYAQPSPFGQSLFGGSNGQQQSQQQMQNPFMQSSGGGFGGFGQQQMPSYAQNYMRDMGNFGGNQGFGGFQQGGYGGFGGGFNPMQGGFGGGQMQNPFMGGMGGFGGGYSPYQMQNPFMGGMGGFGGGYGPPQRGFGGFGGGMGRDRGFGGGYGPAFAEPQVMRPQPAFLQDQEFQGYRQQSDDLSKQMNEYMQKAPMYQQLQDLQGKMRGVQDRYAPQQQMPYDPTGGAPRQAQPQVFPRAPMTQQQFSATAGRPINPQAYYSDMAQATGLGGLAEMLRGQRG